MTIQDFHRNFDIELDKTLDFEYPYILPEQKDYWLNKAQGEFIEDILQPNEPNEKSYEETQDTIESIRTIVKTSDPIIPVSAGSLYKSNLPDDYMYLLRHICKTSDTNCGIRTVGGKSTKQMFLNNMIKDPFWTPSSEEPLYYMMGNDIVYETLNKFQITETIIIYVKQPNDMKYGSEYIVPEADVQCELPDWSHHVILAMAVSMVLENIQSQRYQTNLNELNKIK